MSGKRGGLLLGILGLLALVIGVSVFLALRDPAPEIRSDTAEETAEPEPNRPSSTSIAAAPKPVRTARSTRPDEPARNPATTVGTAKAGGDEPVAPAATLRRTVFVTVVSRSGLPVPNARIKVRSEFGPLEAEPDPGETDATGTVEIRLSGANAFRVRATTDSDVGETELTTLAAGQSLQITVNLEPATVIRGRVVHESVTPVAGAKVRLTTTRPQGPFGRNFHATSDKDGAFSLPAIPTRLAVGASPTVSVTAAGFVRQAQTVDPDDLGSGGLVLDLVRGVRIHGRCVGPDYRPVPEVGISVQTSELQVDTAADGTFVLEGAPLTTTTVLVQPPVHAAQVIQDIRHDGVEMDLGDVVLDPGLPVTGTVLDGEGKPIPRATVHLAHSTLYFQVRDGATGEDGRFTLPNVGEGLYVLTATEPRSGGNWSTVNSARVEGVAGGAPPLTVVITGGLSIRVEFMSEVDRTPVRVPSVEMQVRRTGEEDTVAGWGWGGNDIPHVRVRLGEAGIYDLTLKIPGYEPAVLEGIVISADHETKINALFRKLPE